jgi:SAM-dependent methyltransferase
MNPAPGPLVRLRRRLLELLAPGVFYALKRRFWNRSWARPDFPSPKSFWYLPEGVIQRPIREAVESDWWPKSGRALDIGCGDGRIAAYLASRGMESLGVDFAAPAIERARERFGESPMLRFEVKDICQGTPGPLPFDAVVDRGCFHGLPERLRPGYLRTLRDCTRPGTRLLLMLKLSGRMDLDLLTRERLAAAGALEVRARFDPPFSVERWELIVFNSRGDDDPARSLPGLVVRMTRR